MARRAAQPTAHICRTLHENAGEDALSGTATSAGTAPTTDREVPAPEESTELLSEWHTEANVQASLVTALATNGWRIQSVANTAAKEHGIDVIASRDDQTVGIEVKGFPSRKLRGSSPRGRKQAHGAEHTGRTLVLPSRARRHAAARQGTHVAQCHRLARLSALPQPVRRDRRLTHRSTDRRVVDRPDWGAASSVR
jgi:hypothetical protein